MARHVEYTVLRFRCHAFWGSESFLVLYSLVVSFRTPGVQLEAGNLLETADELHARHSCLTLFLDFVAVEYKYSAPSEKSQQHRKR